MNIIFLTEIQTFPVNGGEKLRSYGLIKMLSNIGYHVTAIINQSKDIQPIKNVEFIQFDFKKFNRIKPLYRDLKTFVRDKSLTDILDAVIEKKKYDIAFIDYKFQGQYISYFKKKNIKVVYGTHNAEAHLIYQKPVVSFKNQVSTMLSFIIESLHEKLFFRRSDALIVVSELDKSFYKKFIPQKKIHYIPNMLDANGYNYDNLKKENYIIMTGNFYAFQNINGIEWFIKNVWNEELWEKTRLLLAGINSKEILAQLQETYTFKNVEAAGMVKDMKSLIKKSTASIVPLLDGGGTRLKCIEAMALKTQIISTSKGAEGIDHSNSIVIADDPVSFKNNIIKVISGEINLTQKAYDVFLNEYSFDANEIRLKKIIETVIQNQ